MPSTATNLTTDERFFYDNAGYSWRGAEGQAEEAGHVETAKALADAERIASDRGWTVEWSDDWDLGGVSHAMFYATDAYPGADGEPDTCENAVLTDEQGDFLAAIGCVDDATDDHRRVIAAELAAAALA